MVIFPAELMPLAVLEAMAASRPVIASDIGGIPEILKEGKTGCLVPPGDADALDGALCLLAADTDLQQKLGKAAANHVRTHFTLPRLLEGVEDLYARLALTSHVG